MPLTRDQQGQQATGQRLLEGDIVERGLIQERGLYQGTRGPNRRGALARERGIACDRLEAGLRRENLAGREQIVNDALRVLRGRRPRYLDESVEGLRLLRMLRRARRALADN
jgi:hypothetical protein